MIDNEVGFLHLLRSCAFLIFQLRVERECIASDYLRAVTSKRTLTVKSFEQLRLWTYIRVPSCQRQGPPSATFTLQKQVTSSNQVENFKKTKRSHSLYYQEIIPSGNHQAVCRRLKRQKAGVEAILHHDS
jgi:hypothetical protein